MTQFSTLFLAVMLVMTTLLASETQAQLTRHRRGYALEQRSTHSHSRLPSAVYKREAKEKSHHHKGSSNHDKQHKARGGRDSQAYSSHAKDPDEASIADPGPFESSTPGDAAGGQGYTGDAYSPEAYHAAPTARSASPGCVFSSFSQLSRGKLLSCKAVEISSMAVPAGKTLDLSGLAPGTTVIFSGETTFGHANWKGPLVLASGSNLHITGAAGSVLNGGGARWWDGLGDSGAQKPKFFAAHDMVNSIISYITIKDNPVQAFSINGAKKLTLDHIKIDSSAGTAGGKAENTDAFDVGSSDGVTISNAWVHNQDDCLAINSGTNILFEYGTCIGGHGLSIGSVGGRDDNKILGVRIVNSHVEDSEHAVRIKTIAGATGSVSNVIYESITMAGIRQNGIVIEQDYLNGGPTGRPTGGVPITDLTLSNISGHVEPQANSKHILCSKGSCTGWRISGVQIQGGRMGACTGCPLPQLCTSSPGSIFSNVQERNHVSGTVPYVHAGEQYADAQITHPLIGKDPTADHGDAYANGEDDIDSPSSPAFLGGARA